MNWKFWRYSQKSPSPDPWALIQTELQDLKKLARRQNLFLEAFKSEVSEAVLVQRQPTLDIYCALADALFYHAQALAESPAVAAAHLETMEIIWERLDQTLAQVDLRMIRQSGAPFDPKIHEAIANRSSGGSDLVVVQVIQPGYLVQHRLQRPAKVVVENRVPVQEGEDARDNLRY